MKVSEGKMKIVSVAYVNAGNNAFGNPRCGWIVLTTNNKCCQKYHFVSEGYDGRAALKRYGFTPKECQMIDERSIPLNITPKEYRRLCGTEAASKKERNNE